MAHRVAGKGLQRGTMLDAGPISNDGSLIILGVDPGLDRTGYAVVSHPGPKVLDAGVIRSSAKKALPDRLAEIAAGIDEVLTEHRIELVAVEELYSHYKHPKTAILMGHARGAILLSAARRDIEVTGISATHVKKTLTGNGHASKIQIQRAVTATLRLKSVPEPADVADALAIALCAMLMQQAARPLRHGGCDDRSGAGATHRTHAGVGGR